MEKTVVPMHSLSHDLGVFHGGMILWEILNLWLRRCLEPQFFFSSYLKAPLVQGKVLIKPSKSIPIPQNIIFQSPPIYIYGVSNILGHQFLFFPYLFTTTQAKHKTTLDQRKASQSPTVWFLRKRKAKQKKNLSELTFLFPFLGFSILKNWKWNPKFISFFPKFSQQPNRPKPKTPRAKHEMSYYL